LPLRFFALIFLARFWLPVAAVSAAELALEFKALPEATQLRPGSAPTLLILTVSASDGQSAAAGWVVVRLRAPPPSGFLSTDFPLVEGTRLLEMRLPVVDGKAQWRQVLPIRGEYRLTAQFDGPAGTRGEQTFSFRVRENERKWIVLSGFILALFVTGFVAGRIFSAPRKRKPRSWFLWPLAVGILLGTGAGAQDAHKRKYSSQIEVAPAIVGMPARVHWWLHPAGVEGRSSVKLTLSIMQLDKGAVVFSVENIPVAGEFSLDYHFADGSDHRVIAIAETEDGQTVRQERNVSVTAVAPPLRARLPALLLFLSVILLGLVAGRWSRRVPLGHRNKRTVCR
jgi:hypothetical protein